MKPPERERSLPNTRSLLQLRSSLKRFVKLLSSTSAQHSSMEELMLLLYVFVMCCQSSCLLQTHSLAVRGKWAVWDSSVGRPVMLQAGSWGLKSIIAMWLDSSSFIGALILFIMLILDSFIFLKRMSHWDNFPTYQTSTKPHLPFMNFS